MFSKSKINDPALRSPETKQPTADASRGESVRSEVSQEKRPPAPKAKPPASVLSSDLQVVGNLRSTGDIQIEGTIEGDIRAHLLTIGEGATIKGEVIADDVVINGRIVGRVRGLKVRLTSTARVEGDIIHKTIAIESGAHFEGSVQRQDDPLSSGKSGGGKSGGQQAAPAPQQAAPAQQQAKPQASGQSSQGAAQKPGESASSKG